MKYLRQYKNLSREIYVLFFGRIVTTIATIDMVLAVIQFPIVLLGGKLADSVNRKKIIVCCDMVTVICY